VSEVYVKPNVAHETFYRRQRKPKGRQLCSHCLGERDTVGRYCKACRAWYMRVVYRPRVKQFMQDALKALAPFPEQS
jgi:hypothetical protein